MSVIQAISYPVSALVQSQQHVPPRDSAGEATSRPSATPTPSSTDRAAVSSRVSAFLSIEKPAAANGSRPDQRSPGPAGSGEAVAGQAIDFDDARIYRPSSRY